MHKELLRDGHEDMAKRLDSWQSTMVDNMLVRYYWNDETKGGKSDELIDVCVHGNEVSGHCEQCDQYEFDFTNRA
jgi:hypothetical protein